MVDEDVEQQDLELEQEDEQQDLEERSEVTLDPARLQQVSKPPETRQRKVAATAELVPAPVRKTTLEAVHARMQYEKELEDQYEVRPSHGVHPADLKACLNNVMPQLMLTRPSNESVVSHVTGRVRKSSFNF